MKTFILILTSIFLFGNAYSQNCDAYIPVKEGQKLMYQTKNKKGKIIDYYSQELLSKKTKGDAIVYKIIRTTYDTGKKREITGTDTLEFLCKGNSFYIDMTSYLNKEQMQGYDDAEIKLDFKNISYPANLKPGTKLDDGYIEAQIIAGIPVGFRTDITNREAVSYETVTTEAGTFKTLKIKQDVSAKVGFMTIKMQTISWIKTGLGDVKSETYDKNGKLFSVTELISIE